MPSQPTEYLILQDSERRDTLRSLLGEVERENWDATINRDSYAAVVEGNPENESAKLQLAAEEQRVAISAARLEKLQEMYKALPEPVEPTVG